MSDTNASLTDRQITDALEAAGVQWQYVGERDVLMTRGSTDANKIIAALRSLLAPKAAKQAGQELDRNLVTLDRRDLWDYVRGAIHAALHDKIPKDCVVSWAWEEATNRTMDIFQKIVDTAPQPASDAAAAHTATDGAASATAGMTLGERITHVGGRTNAAGYIEFGSAMAVDALIQQVLRDLHSAAPKAAEQARQEPAYSWLPIKTAPRDGSNILTPTVAADAAEQFVPAGALNLACYLVDHCEGETITEESLQKWIGAMVKLPRYNPTVESELASMTRMFHAACADLGAINEALGLDPEDGGAEPILDAIAELKRERDQWVDANYAAPASPTPLAAAGLTDEQIFEVLKSTMPEAVRLPPGWLKFAHALLAATPKAAEQARQEPFLWADDEQMAELLAGGRAGIDLRVCSTRIGRCTTPLYLAPQLTGDAATQRHSWATTGMKRDPEGSWVLASDGLPHPIDPTTATFIRCLDLKIQNLTVSAENEISWMAIECRGKVQGLYPRSERRVGEAAPREVREAVESMASLYETNGIYDDAEILRAWLAARAADTTAEKGES